MTNSEKINSLKSSLEILKSKKVQLENEVSNNQENLMKHAGKEQAKSYAEALLVAETEYKATLQAIENNEQRLNAQVKLENSKEYKEKVEEVHRKKIECVKRAFTVADRLQSLNDEIEEIFEEVKKIETLGKETGSYFGGRQSQPFAWLGLVQRDLSRRIKDMSHLKGNSPR